MDWSPLVQIIRTYDRFVLSSHVRPDADAIGSEIGLAVALESLGKKVQIVNPSGWPPNLEFLDPDRRIHKIGEGVSAEDVRNTDVHIIVDTSAWIQLQEVGNAFRNSSAKRRAVIDHHANSDNLGALEFKDITAAATGELIFELIQELDAKIDKHAAMALYCAIATDTGWFRFPSTTSRTMAIGGQLIDLGAEPHKLYQLLYEQHTSARMRLFGRVLSRITIDSGGKLAYLSVSQKDFVDTQAVQADTEELVNECLKVAGVKAAFIAIEQQNQTVKVSFRSKLDTDVASVAAQFGGGGHKQAAGAVQPGPLADALAKVLPAMQQLVAT